MTNLNKNLNKNNNKKNKKIIKNCEDNNCYGNNHYQYVYSVCYNCLSTFFLLHNNNDIGRFNNSRRYLFFILISISCIFMLIINQLIINHLFYNNSSNKINLTIPQLYKHQIFDNNTNMSNINNSRANINNNSAIKLKDIKDINDLNFKFSNNNFNSNYDINKRIKDIYDILGYLNVKISDEEKNEFAKAVVYAEEITGVSALLITALAKTESEFMLNAVSKKRYKSVMQTPIASQRWYSVDVLIGAEILKEKMQKSSGDISKALAMYKGGLNKKQAHMQAAKVIKLYKEISYYNDKNDKKNNNKTNG